MKKVLLVVLAVLLMATAFGCSSAPAETAAPSAEVSAEEPASDAGEDANAETSSDQKIAMVVKDNVNAWFARTDEGVQKFAEDTGTDAFQVGPEEIDAALQVQVVEDLIAQDVDAICIYPIDPTTLEPVLAKAREAGIKVFTQEATTQESKDYDLEPFEPNEYGAALMDQLASEMGEEGTYCTMVSYVTNVSHNQWADAAVARQEEAYPNMKLVDGSDARVESEDNLERAYEKAKELLKKYPDLKGFIGTSSNDVPGICRAIEELGLSGKVFVTGTGLPSMNESYLESGTLKKCYLWDPANSIYALMMLSKNVLDGQDVKDGMDLGAEGFDNLVIDKNDPTITYGGGYVEITKDNINDLGFYF